MKSRQQEKSYRSNNSGSTAITPPEISSEKYREVFTNTFLQPLSDLPEDDTRKAFSFTQSFYEFSSKFVQSKVWVTYFTFKVYFVSSFQSLLLIFHYCGSLKYHSI